MCGMAEREIMPPLGSAMPGYTADRKATNIHINCGRHATACHHRDQPRLPKLLIAHEPTTALDVTIQPIMIIMHDLSVVADMCDRVAIVYLGEVVKEVDAADLNASTSPA